MQAAHPKGSRAFEVLWLGQLVSNLGTQASLYGIGLWLLQQHWRVLDFAAVAIVVQAARLVVLPLLGRQLGGWPPRLTMLVANGIGGSVVAGLVGFLLTPGNQPPVVLLLLALMVSAAAEAVLVLRFSSLISRLVPPGRAQVRAGGLFASADGLVLTMAPFLGAWLAGQRGLHGVLVLDGISFAWAFGCVLLAPWPQALLAVPKRGEVHGPRRLEQQDLSRSLQFLAPLGALFRQPSLAAGCGQVGVGAVSGNRWYEPAQGGFQGSGPGMVRVIWNGGALVLMTLLGIPWGGSLAIRRELIEPSGWRQVLATSLCEDTALPKRLARVGSSYQFRPELIALDRDDSIRLRPLVRWIARQLLTARLHHRALPLVALHGLGSLALLLACLVVVATLVLQGQPLEAGVLGASLVLYELGCVALLLWIGRVAASALQPLGACRA